MQNDDQVKPEDRTERDSAGSSAATGSAQWPPQAMTWEEIKTNHRDAIKRQAIMFYRTKNVFDGEPRKKRWTLCVQMIVETWMALGEQKDHVPTRTFYMDAPNEKVQP